MESSCCLSTVCRTVLDAYRAEDYWGGVKPKDVLEFQKELLLLDVTSDSPLSISQQHSGVPGHIIPVSSGCVPCRVHTGLASTLKDARHR